MPKFSIVLYSRLGSPGSCVRGDIDIYLFPNTLNYLSFTLALFFCFRSCLSKILEIGHNQPEIPRVPLFIQWVKYVTSGTCLMM